MERAKLGRPRTHKGTLRLLTWLKVSSARRQATRKKARTTKRAFSEHVTHALWPAGRARSLVAGRNPVHVAGRAKIGYSAAAMQSCHVKSGRKAMLTHASQRRRRAPTKRPRTLVLAACAEASARVRAVAIKGACEAE